MAGRAGRAPTPTYSCMIWGDAGACWQLWGQLGPRLLYHRYKLLTGSQQLAEAQRGLHTRCGHLIHQAPGNTVQLGQLQGHGGITRQGRVANACWQGAGGRRQAVAGAAASRRQAVGSTPLAVLQSHLPPPPHPCDSMPAPCAECPPPAPASRSIRQPLLGDCCWGRFTVP